ncbi:hypothetical protein Psi02_77040 [Planotetraspora silvatica]|uniref:Uncharacterized protein n=1 Tax=Planotetraspora silvatica TaxID=234614 RepID=A0A8J3UV46_9ACTN|nr:hypothetical protein Psi02_77040 [Planotetraspora silvatica]
MGPFVFERAQDEAALAAVPEFRTQEQREAPVGGSRRWHASGDPVGIPCSRVAAAESVGVRRRGRLGGGPSPRGLIARTIEMMSRKIKARVGNHPLTWAFVCGAGDGNRTRAVSLGIG